MRISSRKLDLEKLYQRPSCLGPEGLPGLKAHSLSRSFSSSSIVKKLTRLRNRDERRFLESQLKLSHLENISRNRFSNKFQKSLAAGSFGTNKTQVRKTKNWICYGKRIGPNLAEPDITVFPTKLAKTAPANQFDSHVPLTQLIYDQQNMIQCFQDRNLYRLLFAFVYSMLSPLRGLLSFENQLPTSLGSLLAHFVGCHATIKNSKVQDPIELKSNRSKTVGRSSLKDLMVLEFGSLTNFGSDRILRSKKLILFARSEVKRLLRKVLFIKPESLLFSQIFLIPLAAVFGILYTFWTFSVSSTVTTKEYIPMIHQQSSSSSHGTFRSRSSSGLPSTKKRGKTEGILNNQTADGFLNNRKGMTDWSQIPADGFEEGILGLDELPFFTSYKVDWSPTRGLADFLRFTNTASKIFILWASLTVFRSLRPVKANRPEMRIQTRFLRPFQNRKRFRDLEGIEKFSGVLTTLTESIQGSFKDPLFYLVLALPNLPFFQPFQKAIGKFRFFLFYGKQTEFLRKPISFLIGVFFPKEKQKQAQTYPKGYLFIGPPGTGKTLLAQAIAGESKVNLICLSASEIQKQLDIGTRIGALRLRNLFEEARTLTPCILFFDEIDTLGRARQGFPESSLGDPSSGSGKSEAAAHEVGSSQEIDLKLFTEFLVQMDSFSVKDGFLVIGTTNFLSSLDPAFIRSGRFDRILGLTYPPKQTRIAILKLHIRKKGNLFDTTIPWNIFGLKTKDLSPADLAKVVNESSLYLLNQLNEPVQMDSIEAYWTSGQVALGHVGYNSSDRSSPSPLRGLPFESTVSVSVNSENYSKSGFFFLVQSIVKDLFLFQPGLIHTSQSLREGLVKILQSKK
jgi:hypothetical protein